MHQIQNQNRFGSRLLKDCEKSSEKGWQFWQQSLPASEDCSLKNMQEWKKINKQRRNQERKQLTLAYRIINSVIIGANCLSVLSAFLILAAVASFLTLSSWLLTVGIITLAIPGILVLAFFGENNFFFFRKLAFRISEKIHPYPDLPEFAQKNKAENK